MSPYVQCRYTSDCSSGQYCDNWQLCKGVSEGTPCDAHYSCKPPSSSLWSGSSDLICCWTTGKCTSHLGCAFSRRVYCSASSDCHANDYCDEKERKCVARIEPGGSCTDNDQVKHNYQCHDGKVVSPCKTNGDCALDEECSISDYHLNYYCIKKPSSSESSSASPNTFSDYSTTAPAEASPPAVHDEINPVDAPKESPAESHDESSSYTYSSSSSSSYTYEYPSSSSNFYTPSSSSVNTPSSSYDYTPSNDYSSSYSSNYGSGYSSSHSRGQSWILPVSISLGILLILILGLIVRRRRQARKAALMGRLSNPKVIQAPPPMLDIQSSPYPDMAFHPYHPQQPYQAHSSPFPGHASSVEPYSVPLPSSPQMPSHQNDSHDLPPYQPN